MFIAHLPAAYITSSLLFPRFLPHIQTVRRFILAGMLGAFAPDLDMLYFYLVDHRQHHHHAYWTHFPLVWGSFLIIAAIWLRFSKNKVYAALAVMFFLNGFIHLFLDSIVGDIRWLAPIANESFSIFVVSARYQPWWLNFILHWSFMLELGILAWAIVLWRRADSSFG